MQKIVAGVVLNTCVTVAACHFILKEIDGIGGRIDHNTRIMFSDIEQLKRSTVDIDRRFDFIENNISPVVDSTNERVSRLEFNQRLNDISGISGSNKIVDSCISQKRKKETIADFRNPSWYYDSVTKCIDEKMSKLINKK